MPAYEICEAVGGVLTGERNTEIKEICTDSRKVTPGCLFIALSGERFDGNRFIGDAFSGGAAVVIGSAQETAPAACAYIRVEDTTKALGDLARYHRAKFSIPVLGVTGSVGKTTTKEMIAAVLSQKYNTLKTEGNFNNAIGLPLTALRLRETHGAAVIEMGMSDLGEISYLTNIAKPTLAVITNIGLSHIENLKTIENTRRAKLEIAEGLPKGGTLFVNGDDPMLCELEVPDIRVLRFGFDNPNNEIRGTVLSEDSFTVDDTVFCVPVGGKHNLYNALCAYAVGTVCGVTKEEAVRGVASYTPDGIRQTEKEIRPGITVLCDYYNASPASVSVSLSMLEKGEAKRKIAVLGDMLELGDYSEKCHREVGREAAEKADILLAVGNAMQFAAEEAKGKIEALHFADNASLSAYLLSILKSGDRVLIKGSHGMKMGEIFEKIR